MQSDSKRIINIRGVAQLASASGLGPEGPVFESQYPDIETETDSPASVSFYTPDIKKLDDLTAVQLYSRIESCIYLTLCLLKVRVDSLPL